MPSKPFHLAWFLQGSSVQAWGEAWTGHIGQTWMQPELFLNLLGGVQLRGDPAAHRLHVAPEFGDAAMTRRNSRSASRVRCILA